MGLRSNTHTDVALAFGRRRLQRPTATATKPVKKSMSAGGSGVGDVVGVAEILIPRLRASSLCQVKNGSLYASLGSGLVAPPVTQKKGDAASNTAQYVPG